jgi:ATP-binding cassette, subfamily F, member 3
MLKIQNLSLQLGNKHLFDHVTIKIEPKEKIGIVGVNGSGKSSLLKTIMGQIKLEDGKIDMEGKIAYLSQEVHIENKAISDNDLTVEEYLVLNLDNIIETWEISKLMNQMNLDGKDPDSKISEMSGGQKVKVEIIKILLSRPNLLILDEPTNFLDIPTAEWLMGYLTKYPEAVLVVSHDLRLMNRAINKIWFLNEFTKKIDVFNDNYENFLVKKALEDENLAKRLKDQDKKVVQLHAKAEKLKIGLEGKGALSARMHDKADAMKEEVEEARKGLQKSAKMSVKFEVKQFPGRRILDVNNLAKSYGNHQVLKNVTFEVIRGETTVIIGKNGAGKSTLLKLLTGNIEANSGSFEWGHNVDYGYYAQEYEGLDYKQNLYDNLRNDVRLDNLYEQDIRRILGTFLFSGDKVNQDVGTLSGGEKTRLAIAKLFAGGFNTLILDEPTTYLDPTSKGILLDALKKYEGTLILVSHLPDFVQELEPERVILMPEEKSCLYHEKFLDRVGLVQDKVE